MNIQKAQWTNSENRVNLSFPITKVNKEKRTVSGFATLDNVDHHGDIVTADASEKAFARFRGNLRQMHQPIAIGKVLSFHPEDFVDKETNKTYKGIYVDAYISKGAQDAWEKILDGTYTGFSIGGNIVTAGYEPGDDNNDRRVIKEYDLMELSVVDSPANQLANIFSIQKMAEGIITENVFWCSKDEVASTSVATTKSCVVCESEMTNIGWVEQSDTEKFEAIEKVIDSYFKKDDAPTSAHEATESAAPGLSGNQTGNVNVIDSTVATLMYPDQNEKNKVTKSDEVSLGKGGNTMAEDTDATIEKSIDAEAPAEEVAVVEEVAVAADDSVEKAVSISEVEDSLDFEKVVSDLKTFLGESLNKSYSDSSAAVEAMNKVFEETSASLAKQIADLGEKYEALNKSVTDMYGKIEYVNHQLTNFESATAVKKSSDLDGSLESKKINKSIWQGAFLKGNSLNNL